jgi:hypothetical protein
LGLFLTSTQVVLRKSKNYAKGDVKLIKASMDRDKFISMVVTQIVPKTEDAIEQINKARKQARTKPLSQVVVQIDNAGGHGGGRGSGMEKTLARLNREIIRAKCKNLRYSLILYNCSKR